MSKDKILVVGTGGLLKQIYSHIYQEIINQNVVFYDDINLNNNELYGCKVIHDFENLDGIGSFIIAISNPLNRYIFTENCLKLGLKEINIIDENINIPDSCKIGNNNIILRQNIIEENVSIDSGNLINLGCYICHNSKIGSFVEMGPRTTILGNVTIGDNVFIGASVTIHPKVKIGSRIKIGAGSIIRNDIPDNLTVYTEFKTIGKLV